MQSCGTRSFRILVHAEMKFYRFILGVLTVWRITHLLQAAPLGFLLRETWWERSLLWPSLSAGASLLERVTKVALRVPPALFSEDPTEKNNNGGVRP
jgi:hypothetical protein